MNQTQQAIFSRHIIELSSKYRELFIKRGGIQFYYSISVKDDESLIYVDPFLPAYVIEEIKNAFKLSLLPDDV